MTGLYAGLIVNARWFFVFRLRPGDVYDRPLIFQDKVLCKYDSEPAEIEIMLNENNENNNGDNVSEDNEDTGNKLSVETSAEIEYDLPCDFESDCCNNDENNYNNERIQVRKIVRRCTGLICFSSLSW